MTAFSTATPCELANTGASPTVPVAVAAVLLLAVGAVFLLRRRPRTLGALALVGFLALGSALATPGAPAQASQSAPGAACGQASPSPSTPEPAHAPDHAPTPLPNPSPAPSPAPPACTPARELTAPGGTISLNEFRPSGVAYSTAPEAPYEIWPAATDGILTGIDPTWLDRIEQLGGRISVTGTIDDERTYPYYVDGSTIEPVSVTQHLAWAPQGTGTIIDGTLTFPQTTLAASDEIPQIQFETAKGLPRSPNRWYQNGRATISLHFTVSYSDGCADRTLRFTNESKQEYGIS